MRRREIRLFFLLAAALTITGCMGQQETGHRIRSFLYLYPRNALEVSVQPEVQEQISCAYPSCEEEWRVIARPDGTMAGLDDGQEYSCLFRESVLEGLPKEPLSGELQAGYVVKGEDTAAFLQEIFSKMGLFPSEYHELLISFLPEMERQPWNLITIYRRTGGVPDGLQITPRPDQVLQVLMAYKPLEKGPDEETEAPELESLHAFRQGFTAVELSGMQIQ